MTYQTKPIKRGEIEFDLIVIGAGLAGARAAKIVALKGKKVAVIDQLGQTGNLTGMTTYPKTKKQFNVSKIHGHGHFLDPWTVSVGGKRYRAHHFLIASGAYRPTPPLPGLKECGFITADQALNHTKLAKNVVILGGSAVASELAHRLATLGIKVRLIESSERLLDNEDEEINDHLETALEFVGVKLALDSMPLMVRKQGQQKVLSYKQHGKVYNVTTDEIILANKEVPYTDLGLENANVEYSPSGIIVTKEMVTSNPHIYAAGNVTGRRMSPHTAEYEGRIAGNNLFSPLKHQANYRAVPRVISINPEFAMVGITENELTGKKSNYQISHVDFDISERLVTENKFGFVKIIADKKGFILGASIVAPRAGEMIQEITLAIQWKIKASKIDYTMHAYSTWSKAIQVCVSKINCR